MELGGDALGLQSLQPSLHSTPACDAVIGSHAGIGGRVALDGQIDWVTVMKKVSLTGYKGASTLEPMNWDYEHLSIQQFLERAYQSAKRLDDMRTV